MNKTYKNRQEGAGFLARALEQYPLKNPIVLAIPRGGVETGYYVAEHLDCELAVIVSRKLGYMAQPELAFGAISEGKSLYLDPRIRIPLTKDEINRTIRKEEVELARRIQEYRDGEPLPDLQDRTVILVDDGIATGGTIMAAIDSCRKMKAGRIIAAAPVAPFEMQRKLKSVADDVVITELPEFFYAVSQAYVHFPGLTDREVKQFLNMHKKKRQSGKTNQVSS